MSKELYREFSRRPFRLGKIEEHDIMVVDLVDSLGNVSHVKIVGGECKKNPSVSHFNDRVGLSFSNLGTKLGDKEDVRIAWWEKDYQKVIDILASGYDIITNVRVR